MRGLVLSLKIYQFNGGKKIEFLIPNRYIGACTKEIVHIRNMMYSVETFTHIYNLYKTIECNNFISVCMSLSKTPNRQCLFVSQNSFDS